MANDREKIAQALEKLADYYEAREAALAPVVEKHAADAKQLQEEQTQKIAAFLNTHVTDEPLSDSLRAELESMSPSLRTELAALAEKTATKTPTPLGTPSQRGRNNKPTTSSGDEAWEAFGSWITG